MKNGLSGRKSIINVWQEKVFRVALNNKIIVRNMRQTAEGQTYLNIRFWPFFD